MLRLQKLPADSYISTLVPLTVCRAARVFNIQGVTGAMCGNNDEYMQWYCQAYADWLDWMADDAAFYNQLMSAGGYRYVPYAYCPPPAGGYWPNSMQPIWDAYNSTMLDIHQAYPELSLDELYAEFGDYAGIWDQVDMSRVGIVVEGMLYQNLWVDLAGGNMNGRGFEISFDGYRITSVPVGFEDVVASYRSQYWMSYGSAAAGGPMPVNQPPNFMSGDSTVSMVRGGSNVQEYAINLNGGATSVAEIQFVVDLVKAASIYDPGIPMQTHWEYDISSGSMSIVSADGNFRQVIATGYSGFGPHQNDPNFTYAGWNTDQTLYPGVPSKPLDPNFGVGPLPASTYNVSALFDGVTLNALRLDPVYPEHMLGIDQNFNYYYRSGFQIHGGNVEGTSSVGCIILPVEVRRAMGAYTADGSISQLVVVP